MARVAGHSDMHKLSTGFAGAIAASKNHRKTVVPAEVVVHSHILGNFDGASIFWFSHSYYYSSMRANISSSIAATSSSGQVFRWFHSASIFTAVSGRACRGIRPSRSYKRACTPVGTNVSISFISLYPSTLSPFVKGQKLSLNGQRKNFAYPTHPLWR